MCGSLVSCAVLFISPWNNLSVAHEQHATNHSLIFVAVNISRLHPYGATCHFISVTNNISQRLCLYEPTQCALLSLFLSSFILLLATKFSVYVFTASIFSSKSEYAYTISVGEIIYMPLRIFSAAELVVFFIPFHICA